MKDTSTGRLPPAETDDTADRRVADTLWHFLDRLRGTLDPTSFADAVLSLAYRYGILELAEWEPGGRDLDHALLADLAADGADPEIVRPLLDSVRKVSQARQLAPLVNVFDQHYSRDNNASPAKIFGALLDRISLETGRGGEVYTPQAITDLVAGLLDPGPNAHVLDPCCKAGGFPAAIANRLARQDQRRDQLTVELADYSTRSCALAYLHLRLWGLVPRILPNHARGLPTAAPDQRYDVVTANPPFNLKPWDRDGLLDQPWQYGTPPAHNANFAWIQYVVASLKEDGRAAVVMPHSAGLSENTWEKRIRTALLKHGVVSAVIALPGQMFTATAIPVSLWLLQPPPGDPPSDVLFVDATGLGTEPERGRRTLSRPTIDRIVATYHQWCTQPSHKVNGLATGVPFKMIQADEYRLNPRAYVEPAGQDRDPDKLARKVNKVARRLDWLTAEVNRVDRTIEAHMRELSW